LDMGASYVLVTGTHENTVHVANTLYDANGVVRSDQWERLPGSYHGSGCTLASAIAAALANGLDLPEAVREAQEYTWQTSSAGFRSGMGQDVPDRCLWARALSDSPLAESEDEWHYSPAVFTPSPRTGPTPSASLPWRPPPWRAVPRSCNIATSAQIE